MTNETIIQFLKRNLEHTTLQNEVNCQCPICRLNLIKWENRDEGLFSLYFPDYRCGYQGSEDYNYLINSYEGRPREHSEKTTEAKKGRMKSAIRRHIEKNNLQKVKEENNYEYYRFIDKSFLQSSAIQTPVLNSQVQQLQQPVKLTPHIISPKAHLSQQPVYCGTTSNNQVIFISPTGQQQQQLILLQPTSPNKQDNAISATGQQSQNLILLQPTLPNKQGQQSQQHVLLITPSPNKQSTTISTTMQANQSHVPAIQQEFVNNTTQLPIYKKRKLQTPADLLFEDVTLQTTCNSSEMELLHFDVRELETPESPLGRNLHTISDKIEEIPIFDALEVEKLRKLIDFKKDFQLLYMTPQTIVASLRFMGVEILSKTFYEDFKVICEPNGYFIDEKNVFRLPNSFEECVDLRKTLPDIFHPDDKKRVNGILQRLQNPLEVIWEKFETPHEILDAYAWRILLRKYNKLKMAFKNFQVDRGEIRRNGRNEIFNYHSFLICCENEITSPEIIIHLSRADCDPGRSCYLSLVLTVSLAERLNKKNESICLSKTLSNLKF